MNQVYKKVELSYKSFSPKSIGTKMKSGSMYLNIITMFIRLFALQFSRLADTQNHRYLKLLTFFNLPRNIKIMMKNSTYSFFGLGMIFLAFLIQINVLTAQNCSVNAGVPASFCPNAQIPLLGGESGLPVPGTFKWTQVSGPSVIIDNPMMETSTVTGYMGGGVYTFRASLTCEDGKTAFQNVTYTVLASTPAVAGPDLNGCPGVFSLSANNPGVGELGSWSIVGPNNGVSIAQFQNPNTNITLLNGAGGKTTLRWTITNPTGCFSNDDIIVTNCGGVSPVTAGPDQILGNCFSLTTQTCLNASPAGFCGMGTWSVISGPNVPVFANISDPNSCITNLMEGCYLLRWAAKNATCMVDGEDMVQICVPKPTQNLTAASSSNQFFCDNRASTVLYGSVTQYTNETVMWAQTGGPAVTIVSPTTSVTSVTGLDGMSSYTFTYTITNPITGCSSSTNVTIGFGEPGSVVDIVTPSPIINECNDKTVTFTYTQSGPGAVEWRVASSPTGILTDWAVAGSSPFTIIDLYGPGNPVPFGVYVIEIRKNIPVGAGCTTSANDQITVVFSEAITGANAGTDQDLPCSIYSTMLIGNVPFIGSGTWSQVGGPTMATLASPTTNNSAVSFPSGINGAYVFRWTVSGGAECDPAQDDVELRVTNIGPTVANAGPDQAVCFGTPVYLMGNIPNPSDIGTWTVTPNAGVIFSDINDPKAVVTGLVANTVYNFTWTITNKCGMASEDIVIITNNTNQGPDIADAGPDQCLLAGVPGITLSGNSPTFGTGLWTKILTIPNGLPSNITDPTKFNTGVTGVSNGTYYFEWQNLSGGCSPTRDTVIITISNPVTPAGAGLDQQICGSVATLAANAPLVGAGMWTQIFGPGGAVITNPLSPSTMVSALSAGVYDFVWTIKNGACSSADTVRLLVSTPALPAIAGPDQMICGPTMATLAANAVSSGYWTVVSGPNTPIFSNILSPTSTISGLVFGTYILKWNSSSGAFCPILMDEVQIVVVPTANAGPDQTFCEDNMSVNLIGNVSSIGTWTQFSGAAATVTPTSDNTATASGLMVPIGNLSSVYEFKYTINQPGCMSMDIVKVTLFMPPNQAAAGPDQEACDLTGNTTYTLAANNPTVPYVGSWTIIAGPGGGTFTPNANTPNAMFNPGGYGVYLLAWSISNGACAKQDEVRITNYQPPSTADAGPDQNVLCNNQVTMSAVNPAVGLGMWTLVSKPALAPDPIIASPILFNTGISGMVPGTYVFRWTTSNGLCPNSFDDVSITILPQPTTANAGLDQAFCNMTSTMLAATSLTMGTGMWTVVSQPGGPLPMFADATAPNTMVSNLSNGTYVLRWTTTLGICTSLDEVTIINYALPTVANTSGTTTSLCFGQQMLLVGNNPINGNGMWTQTSGGPATILNPSNPSTQVIGFGASLVPYTFKWTITNGNCTPSESSVSITVNTSPSQITDAGANLDTCNVTSVILDGNIPQGGEIGTWSFSSGPNLVTFTNAGPNSYNATVNGLVGGSPNTYGLRWTVSAGACSTTDTVRIRVWAQPIANAGPDQEVCGATTFQLAAVPLPAGFGAGMWTKVSGPAAVITTPSSPTSTVTGVAAGTYVFRWTAINGTICPPSIDNVTIINRGLLTGGPTSLSVCVGGSPILTSNATGGSGSYTYQWYQSPGDCTAPVFSLIPGATGANYQPPAMAVTTSYRVIISDANSICNPYTSSCATVTVVADPSISIQPMNAIVCTGANHTLSVTATGGTPLLIYQWQVSSVDCNGTWSNIPGATNSTYITPSITANAYYRVIVSATGLDCNPVTSDCAMVTVVPDPVISTQPVGATICTGGTHNMSVVASGNLPPGTLTYQWQRAPTNAGAWSDIPGATTSSYSTVPLTTTTFYRVLVRQAPASSGCETISMVVEVTVVPDPSVSISLSSMNVCTGGNSTLTANATGGTPLPLIYAWEFSTVSNAGPWTPIGSGGNVYNTGPLTVTTYYHVIVSASGVDCGSATSAPVTVNVLADPFIVTQPTGTTVCTGGTPTLSVVATGGTPTLLYQWQINTANDCGSFTSILGATNATYTTPELTVKTSYRVLISAAGSDCDPIESACIMVDVVADPVINADPVGATICEGSTHMMSVDAMGNLPPGTLTYQWQQATAIGGPYTNIPGATAQSYTSAATILPGTYYYKVLVGQAPAGSGCSTLSAAAVLNVNAQPDANAGPDQNLCLNIVSSTFLFGNTPSQGVGTWTQVSGPFGAPLANILDDNNPNTEVTGLADLGNYVFRWTITNAPCALDFDEVTIRVESCCQLEVICPLPNQGTFSCAASVPIAAVNIETFNNIDAASNIRNFCQTPTVNVTETRSGTGCASSPLIISRRYIIIDAGAPLIGEQRDTCDVTYTVIDTIKPVFMVAPQDLVLQCNDPDRATKITAWVTSNAGSMGMDNCLGTVTTTTVVGTAVTLCGGSSRTPYTITISDACGNNIRATANVIINDNTAPVITLPTATATVACSGDVSGVRNTWLGNASASDGCGGATTLTSSLIASTRTCSGVNTLITENHLFTATDACGNVSTSTASFTITDNTSPTITAPANLTIACGSDNASALTAWLQKYTVTEACQTYTVTNNFTGTLPNLCNGAAQIVTWTVRDQCGATGTATSSIIVTPDVTGPVFRNCPANITVNADVSLCAANVIYSTPVAFDCNEPTTVVRTSGIASGQTFPIGVSTILFTATDNCGNTTTCTFTITVVDSAIPSLKCPGSDVVRCTASNSCTWVGDASINPTGVENCPGAMITYTVSGATTASGTGSASAVTFNLGTSSVKYKITASNGQQDSCTFNVVVNDCTKPVITCPSTLTLSCGGIGNAAAITAWLATVTATDNCSALSAPVVTNTLLATIDQCGATETRLYQFTATDGSGNTSLCTANVVIQDITAPVIGTAASSLTVECNGNGNVAQLLSWLASKGGAVATDDCSGSGINWSNNYGSMSDLCGATGATTVIFTATDSCGNSATTSATFTISDTRAPNLVAPANITLSCGDSNNQAIVDTWLRSAIASDSCGGVVVTNNFTTIPTNCVVGRNTTSIIFTATDNCGMATTATATITVIDNVKPVIMVSPVDLVLECGATTNTALIAAWVSNLGGALVVDNCAPSLITSFVAGTSLPQCGLTSITPYLLTATDSCGNSISRYAYLRITDTQKPNLILPSAIDNVTCNGNVAAARDAWFASASANDACSNTVTITQVLISKDVVCETNNTVTIERYLFKATDACGNDSIAVDTFRIEDNTSPTITAPANLTIACGSDNASALTAWLQRYTVTEACQTYTVTNNFTGTLPNLCNGATQIVTWTVRDQCGATGTATSSIIVTPDVTGPVFRNCPANITVNADVSLCAANVIYSTPIAFDCNEPTTVVRTSGIASGQTFPIGVSTILFTATDNCGNTTTCTFTITVVDSAIPSLKCPGSDVVRCTASNSCTWVGDASINPTGVENCPGAVITYTVTGATMANGIGSASVVTFNLGVSKVEYILTATNGQADTCTFNVVVNDCTKPVITCPSTLTLSCGGIGNAAAITAWLATATATDNCSAASAPVVTSTLLATIDQCGATETRLYQFTATDGSGNTSLCTANVVIQDITAPVIGTAASSLTVECNGNGNVAQLLSWLASKGGAVATDDCSGSGINWSNNYGSMSDLCGATGATTVIFTATDSCGNSATTSATFTISDTRAPNLVAPANITLSCGDTNNAVIVSAWLQSYSASDTCGGVVVTNNYTTTPITCVVGNNIATVIFTATDDCGLQTMGTATITVVDNIKPLIMTSPSDLIVDCADPLRSSKVAAWLASNGGAISRDNCASALKETYVAGTFVRACGETGRTPYTYTVADECGNSVVRFASLIVIDTIAPILTAQAVSTVVECDGTGNVDSLNRWLAVYGGALATDGCTSNLIWSVNLIQTLNTCASGDVKTYRFTVRDSCGNSSFTEASFSIRDRVAPTITTPASNFTAQCNGSSNAAQILSWLNNNGGARATDVCSNIRWTNNYGAIIGDCGTTGAVRVTFYAMDACNNVDSTSAMFIINDTQAPVWEKLPQNIEIQCNAGSPNINVQITAWLNLAGGGEAKDSCSLVRYSNNFTALANGCSATTGNATVTFTATDGCGNSVTAQAIITVVDAIGPDIVTPAKDTTTQCSDQNATELAAWLANNGGAVATDACGSVTWLAPVLMQTIPLCGGTSSRVYMFRAQDECSNISLNTIARFTIRDTIAPVFNAAVMNDTVQCNGLTQEVVLNAWLARVQASGATDYCSSPLRWEWDLIRDVDRCGVTGSQIYRFTVYDACNNSATMEGSFTVIDTVPPVIVGGVDRSGECISTTAGNDTQLLSWLNTNAGATATDGCSQVSWSNNFNEANFVNGCNGSRSIIVTFYASDVCGNVDSIVRTFSTGDLTPPVFTNCPRPPVIVDAPQGWCSAFVNFSLPTATDNCGIPAVTQVDTTGLTTGSLFPVGLTILKFEARDACGNVDTCVLKIIVNDFHTPPTITCRKDTMVLNNPGICGAVVNNIAPAAFDDNCKDNISVSYVVRDSSNVMVGTGLGNASGFLFPVGMNTVTYTVADQPSLLITEIIQNGVVTGVEISNFGAASVKLACLEIKRSGSIANESYIVPEGVIIAAGGVYTQAFTNIPLGSVATYSIDFAGRVYDQITINSGLNGSGIFRIEEVDTDTNADFVVADKCNLGSYGVFNPQLTALPSNGKLTSLQSRAPSTASCSFKVTVRDVEAPICMTNDTTAIIQSGSLSANQCNELSVLIPAGIVGEVYIRNLVADIDSVGKIKAYLTSPSGTKIRLFSGLCGDANDIDIKLSDFSLSPISGASCSPLGNGNYYKPSEAFKKFVGESSGGSWKLSLSVESGAVGTISNFELVVIRKASYNAPDTTLTNDALTCAATYMWTHPVFSDNCCEGSMIVKYKFSNSVTGASSTVTETILNLTNTINLDGTKVMRTFGVGTTQVEYTLTDRYGNESTCGFKVVVRDTEKPRFLTGCRDTIINLRPRACTASGLNLPTVTDNCGIDTIRYTLLGAPLNINMIPIGVNVITMIVTDIYGNSTSCTFTVTVNEYVPTTTELACIGTLNVSLDETCKAVLTASMLLQGTELGCLDNYCIEVRDANGNIHANMFDQSDMNQKFKVSIRDCRGSGNSCWSDVLIEKKLPPVITCPRDTVLACNIDPNALFTSGPNIGKLRTGEVSLQNCQVGYTISYVDEEILNVVCGSPRGTILRRWTVKNDKGELATCIQTITIQSYNPSLLAWPADLVGNNALSCSDVNNNADFAKPINTGFPTINGIPAFGTNMCDVSIGSSDRILNDVNCPSSYLIFRKWEIFNRCQPYLEGVNPVSHTQVIRVEDRTAPAIIPLADVTISTNAWECAAEFKLPVNIATDNCGTTSVKWSLQYGFVSGGIIYGLQKGETIVRLRVTDQCGNAATSSFKITVVDKVAPVATAKQFITVSLTESGADGIPGIAKLFASNFDNGSYDNCGKVRLEVRRDDGAPACANEGDLYDHDNNASTPKIRWNNNLTYSNDGHLQDSQFDTDKGEYVKFCCEDIGQDVKVWLRVWDEAGNYNETWSMVKVEDKTLPIVMCKPVTRFCDESVYYQATPVWETYDKATSLVDSASVPNIKSLCGNYALEFRDQATINTCNDGSVVRRWRVVGTSVVCDQIITIALRPRTAVLDYPIALHIWNKCTLTEAEVLANTIKSTKTPAYGGSGDGGNASANAPFVSTYRNIGCEVFGRTIKIEEYTVGDGCKKWKVSFEYINWCGNTSAGSRTTIFKYEDTTAPVINASTRDTVELGSSCNLTYITKATGSDDGGCSQGYNWTVNVSGVGYSQTKTGTGERPNLSFTGLVGGTYQVNYKLTDGCGNVAEKIVTLVVKSKAPTPYCVEISSAVMKNGIVELWAKDFDKGSFANCSGTLIYYTFDNARPVTASVGVVHYFKGNGETATLAEYNAGTAQQWKPADKSSGKLFGCKIGNGSTFPSSEVIMTVWDNTLASEFCKTRLTLIDNQNACGSSSTMDISGSITTEASAKLVGVNVMLSAVLNEFPKYGTTDIDGGYSFKNLPIGANYTVTPTLNTKHDNGVNTLDLLLIQKHILALNKFDSPYKMIAADIDNDQVIRVNDLVELRKLVLGIYVDFPNNQSWRFVATDQTMSTNKVWPFNEIMTHADLKESKKGSNFVAVKIGDVDATASTSAVSNVTEPRNVGITLKASDRQVRNGETVEIELEAENFNKVYGFQLSANLKGLTLLGAEGRGIDLDATNVASPRQGIMTMSWNNSKGSSVAEGGKVMILTFKATQDGNLSEMLQLSSAITRAEAYVGDDLEISKIQLSFRNDKKFNFALEQNTPNPWKGETSITYVVPESGAVKLTVYDITGKAMFTKTVKAAKGANQATFTKSELSGATGVMIYKIEAGQFTAQKKMIVID